MKENFLHFISSVPCILGINGETIEKIDNKKIFECDVITNTNEMFVSFTPIISDKNYIPYTYLLETSNTPTTNNSLIKVIPFPEDNYDIIMQPFSCNHILNSQVICNSQLGKYYVSIVNGYSTKINIFSGASVVFTLDLPTISKAKVEMQHELIIIEGVHNDNYHLLIINSENFQILFNDECHSIERDDSYIQSLKNLNDISKTAEVNKINLKTKDIEKYYVYQFDSEKNPSSNILIPMNFLQSIQIGNEHIAKKLLTDNFSNATISTLNNYFGQIKEIYLNRHYQKVGVLNYTILSDSYKNYNFIMEKNKIADIQEVSQ